MQNLPILDDHTVIELSREGGLAVFPGLSLQHRIALAELAPAKRERLCELLRRSAPLAQSAQQARPPGYGDQRYYRIQIYYQRAQQAPALLLELLIPENSAPTELTQLWKNGAMDDTQ